MNGTNRINRGEMTILGCLLAIGLVAGGWALGAQIKAVRLGDRYVTVRGLAERTVKSDLAIWTLDYKEAGDDLPSLYSKIEGDRKIILQFLTEQGIQSSETEIGIVGVVDTQANEYGNSQNAAHRYIAEQQIIVRTNRVDQVAAAAQKTDALVRQGIALTHRDFGGAGLVYKFTGLNGIKPDMITEATRNARTAAERFATDAGSSVGTIRQATQGVFSIRPADSGVPADSDNGPSFGNDSDSSLMKTVRVVTEVEYYLEK